jgi:hypothetical protein
MTHDQSFETHAPERYLLGEMSELEKFHFEEHYFTCEECAESVRLGAVLAGNTRAAFAHEPATQGERRRSWLDWLRVPVLAPSLAAVALACAVGYQALVQMPALKQAYSAQAIEPVGLRSASRGAEPSVPVAAQPGFFSVAILLSAGPEGGPVSYSLVDSSGKNVTTGSAAAPAPGHPLILLFPNNAVSKDNRYTLRLEQANRDLGEFPFAVAPK